MEHWDPIGVRNTPEASDEYDRYVGEVYVMLMDDRASEATINAYLFATATEHMGLSPSDYLAAARTQLPSWQCSDPNSNSIEYTPFEYTPFVAFHPA
jgi:hypothetical protein